MDRYSKNGQSKKVKIISKENYYFLRVQNFKTFKFMIALLNKIIILS